MNNEVFSQGYQFLKFHHEYPYSWMTESCPKHFLAYMCRGRGRLSFAQTHLDVTEGDVFYIPHGIAHAGRATRESFSTHTDFLFCPSVTKRTTIRKKYRYRPNWQPVCGIFPQTARSTAKRWAFFMPCLPIFSLICPMSKRAAEDRSATARWPLWQTMWIARLRR